MRFAGASKLTLVRREQDQFRIDRFDGTSDCIGEFGIAHRHVIKCAVRLDVIGSHIQRRGEGPEDSKLIGDGVEHFFVGYYQLLASEILAIEKARMRSNSNSMGFGRRNGGVHCIGITGVKTGRDIRGTDQLEQLGIVA